MSSELFVRFSGKPEGQPTASGAQPRGVDPSRRRMALDVNVGVHDVVEEVGHPELHCGRDDLEDCESRYPAHLTVSKSEPLTLPRDFYCLLREAALCLGSEVRLLGQLEFAAWDLPECRDRERMDCLAAAVHLGEHQGDAVPCRSVQSAARTRSARHWTN